METSILSKIYPISFAGYNLNKINKGFLSENHVLSKGETKYFLKKYRFEDPAVVARVHQVKNFFSESGIPVIMPIQTVDNESYFIYQGKIYALFPYVSSIEIDRTNLDKKNLLSLAQMLAKIHLLSKHTFPKILPLSIDKPSEFNNNYQEIIRILESKQERDAFDRLAIKNLNLKKRLVESFDLKTEDYYLVSDHLLHGDYQETNVFFKKNGEVEWIFDLEKTTVKPRIYELLRSMDYMCLNGNFTKDNLNKAIFYMKSYHQKYPLKHDELRKGLNYYYKERIEGLWIEREHYVKNNFRADVFLERNANSIDYLSDNFDVLSDYFLNNLF